MTPNLHKLNKLLKLGFKITKNGNLHLEFRDGRIYISGNRGTEPPSRKDDSEIDYLDEYDDWYCYDEINTWISTKEIYRNGKITQTFRKRLMKGYYS